MAKSDNSKISIDPTVKLAVFLHACVLEERSAAYGSLEQLLQHLSEGGDFPDPYDSRVTGLVGQAELEDVRKRLCELESTVAARPDVKYESGSLIINRMHLSPSALKGLMKSMNTRLVGSGCQVTLEGIATEEGKLLAPWPVLI